MFISNVGILSIGIDRIILLLIRLFINIIFFTISSLFFNSLHLFVDRFEQDLLRYQNHTLDIYLQTAMYSLFILNNALDF